MGCSRAGVPASAGSQQGPSGPRCPFFLEKWGYGNGAEAPEPLPPEGGTPTTAQGVFISVPGHPCACAASPPRAPVPKPYPAPSGSVQAHGTANRMVGRAVPVMPLRGVTGEPHSRLCTANPARSATYPPCGNCTNVARTFLSAHVREGKQECLPHTTTLHRCC